MAAHDSSWEIFRSELKHWMELRRFTNKALAEAINADLPSSGLSAPVDEQIIKRWRHSTSPPLMTLKVIGRILGMSSDPTGRAIYDPTHLPRVMGILAPAPENPELIEAAYRLQTVRAKIAEAQSTLTAITADEGAVNVVRTATASGLGAAVLPVFEGPRGYPMHVSDRIDLRAQGAEATAPQPNQYPLVHDALHAVQLVLVVDLHPRLLAGGDEAQYQTLLRLRGRDGELHSAARILPAAESAGLLYDIDRRVIELALATLVERGKRGGNGSLRSLRGIARGSERSIGSGRSEGSGRIIGSGVKLGITSGL